MYRRRHRARAGGGRKAAGEGADALMECEDNPDYVECLVRKYMKKCRVESSTDSESDIHENFGSQLLSPHGAGCLPKKVEILKFQFLDPYDGDSEETSAQSDSSSQDHFLSGNDSVITKDNPINMDCGSAPEQPTSLADDCEQTSQEMDHPHSRSPTAPESLKERSGQRTRGATCPSDISMDSGVATEAASVQLGHFVLIGSDPRAKSCGSSVFPASLTSEENSDFGVFETSVMKRKFGVKLESEKLRRKKARVAEHSS